MLPISRVFPDDITNIEYVVSGRFIPSDIKTRIGSKYVTNAPK